ncbi:thioredoxin domain-containing protein [Membranihabitans marinus]|uniref:hypothetical protein n=1 Tax=Membranihabitans marinus TaxID=1227546 RepID=UPI001F21DF68|nr:hypothetical protein [Membranihabitans marinus]
MELIYGFDPLCMWSYAFTPNLREFVSRHEKELFTSVVCSGMIRGGLRSTISSFSDRLSKVAENIETVSGISFGQPFYNNLFRDDVIMDSVPGSIAINALKMTQKNKVLDLAMQLSTSIYHDGISPGNVDDIAEIMSAYTDDVEDIKNVLTSDQGKYLAYQDFQWFEAADLKQTPVVILDIGGELVQLTKGYTTLEKLEQVYEKVVEEYKYLLN